MIEHVYRRAAAARSVSRGDRRDRRRAHRRRGRSAFGGDARHDVAASHQSGTDRLAEVAASLDCDVVVNVQGDEPLLDPTMIDAAVAPFAADPALEMSTLRRRIDDAAELHEPERHQGRRRSRRLRAVFLARADPVHARRAARRRRPGRTSACTSTGATCLLRLAALPPTALERAEALEQLRALEHGIRIKAIETTHDTIGVDTPRGSRARARAARRTPCTT